jgi:crossover junction endodeoxyribonuclease RuvC
MILGIDPGSITTGYGIITEERGELRCVAYGTFGASNKTSFSERLLKIGEGLQELFKEHKIKAVVIEKTFFAKNVDSVTKLSHARGVCMYEAARAQVPIFEYSPTEVKMNVVGHGRAGKDQVQIVVGQLLKMNIQQMAKFDMSDALALAIHHCLNAGTMQKIKEREITT